MRSAIHSSSRPMAVVIVTSASKCLAPGLRVSWLSAPRRQLLRLAEAARIVTVTQPALTGAVVTQWINEGRAEALLHWQRQETAARQAIAAEHLAGLDWRGHEAALHIWLTLPPPWRSDDFTAAARQAGIAISPLGPFTVENPVPPGESPQSVRITLSQPPDRLTLTRALLTLRDILERGPNRLRAII